MKQLILIIIAISTFACSRNQSVNSSSNQNTAYMFEATDTSWKSLTLRQKIGQTMLMLPDRELEMELGNGNLTDFFNRYPVSGFFMGWKLFNGVSRENRVNHVRFSVKEYQAASQLPLIFQEDYESGVGLDGMTPFPRLMSLGATNSPELAYQFGESVAKECRSLGVSWVLHPCADINLNPLNPIASTRALSDDPDKIIRLLSKQIEGLQRNGVAATIKHFPGDGVDSRDQHLVTTCNSLDMETWWRVFGKVYKELINSGVASIMPGHITLPAYQKAKINGFLPPATLSKELLTDLLKGELGFNGVIVSDAMVMGGFRGYYDSELEGEIESFKAGVDIMLWPSYEFMDSLEARIIRGEIPMQRLDDAVSRVWAMKERFGLLEKDRQLMTEVTDEEKQKIREASRNIAEQSLTLVRDSKNALPLSIEKDKKILLVAVTPKARKGRDRDYIALQNLHAEFIAKGFNKVDFRRNILYEEQGWKDDSYENYDRIIYLVVRNTHSPFGPLLLWDDECESVWAASSMPKDKLIVISLGCPYIGSVYFERANTYINTYSNDYSTHTALLKALLGQIPFVGVSPVSLELKDFQVK